MDMRSLDRPSVVIGLLTELLAGSHPGKGYEGGGMLSQSLGFGGTFNLMGEPDRCTVVTLVPHFAGRALRILLNPWPVQPPVFMGNIPRVLVTSPKSHIPGRTGTATWLSLPTQPLSWGMAFQYCFSQPQL